MDYRVPQGSVSGPLSFSVHMLLC